MTLMAVASFLPNVASAAFIDFSGTVTTAAVSYGSPGIANGDALTGFIEINDAAAAPGTTFDAGDLLGFDFSVGGVDFALPGVSPFIGFGGTVSADGLTLSNILIQTNAMTSVPNCVNCFLTIANTGLFTVNFADYVVGGFFTGNLNTPSIRPQPVADADVPEPSAAVLFAIGLMLLSVSLWRRSAR